MLTNVLQREGVPSVTTAVLIRNALMFQDRIDANAYPVIDVLIDTIALKLMNVQAGNIHVMKTQIALTLRGRIIVNAKKDIAVTVMTVNVSCSLITVR